MKDTLPHQPYPTGAHADARSMLCFTRVTSDVHMEDFASFKAPIACYSETQLTLHAMAVPPSA
jgi:hypothetical protein